MHKILTPILMLLFFVIAGWAHGTYTGYSGAPGRSMCATSCHGTTGGTITLNGFPTNYTPGQVYQLVISHSSGTTIRNFNASCRIGTGSNNAGTIAAGLNCSVYNVTGESNGIHFTNVSLDSGLFMWTAPAAGTGTVTMYVAGLQGSHSGQNSIIAAVSNESVGTPPSAATNPAPANNSSLVSPGLATLTWLAATGATSYDVCFGTTNPPPLVTNCTATSYSISTTLALGTTYFWRIDSRNTSGVTTGTVWQFSTLSVAQPSNPVPANGDTVNTNPVTLQWQLGASPAATNLILHFGQTTPPPVYRTIPDTTAFTIDSAITDNATYYWSIDQIFPWGTVAGTIWSCTYADLDRIGEHAIALPTNSNLLGTYPNPFNPTTTISYSLAKSNRVELKLFDVNGRLVRTETLGTISAGKHSHTMHGENLAAGTYFLNFIVGENYSAVKKLVLLK